MWIGILGTVHTWKNEISCTATFLSAQMRMKKMKKPNRIREMKRQKKGRKMGHDVKYKKKGMKLISVKTHAVALAKHASTRFCVQTIFLSAKMCHQLLVTVQKQVILYKDKPNGFNTKTH